MQLEIKPAQECKFFFTREERKYLIDAATYEKLKYEIPKFLTKETHKGSGSLSFIQSIYLENSRWKTCCDHKSRKNECLK